MTNKGTMGGNPTFGEEGGTTGGGGGAFPGFGGAPPAVASTSSAGAAGTASRSDHTHALDIVAYNPSIAGMQATGVIQQTYAAPTATPTVLNVATSRIPFGNAGVLTTSANLNFNSANTTLLVGGLTADPFGGLARIYAGANVNGLSLTLVVANQNNGAAATTNLAMLCGSTDGSVGASSLITVNSAANASAGLLGGAQTMSIQHQPSTGVGSRLVIANHSGTAGSDIVFTTGAGNTEVLRLLQANQQLQVAAAGIVAAGANAVLITNSPGAATAPAEYWAVRGTGGALRYIPLLAP